jgi:fluoride exporter
VPAANPDTRIRDFRKADAMGERILLAIFAGGAAGGLARAALEHAWPADGHSWPWVTFAVNVAGTALLASIITHLNARPYARPLVGIGFCGALTTFSTLQLEALELADNHHAALGAAYAAASIGAGLLAAYAASARGGRS